MLVAVAMIGVGAFMSWEMFRFFTEAYRHRGPAAKAEFAHPSSTLPKPVVGSAGAVAPWQNVLSEFGQAAQFAKSSHITHAEMRVDQATSEMEDARVHSRVAPASFFSRAAHELDAILKAQPASVQDGVPGTAGSRLVEHVAQARIELAEVRSAGEPLPAGSVLASDALAKQASADEAAAGAVKAASTSEMPTLPAGHIVINAPREIAEKGALDPKTLGGSFLDASMMPDDVEILLPPATRELTDDVRVNDLTIAGAAQTLDGIHWNHVTFIETRLRYEDGQLDLHDVRFIRCTFGFPSDERGASIANAIALGKTTFTLQ